jgi:hypothetical protein
MANTVVGTWCLETEGIYHLDLIDPTESREYSVRKMCVLHVLASRNICSHDELLSD